MRFNELQPAKGSRFAGKRLGRGIGSGLGKTSGKGHKGQKARSGGYHKVGFEGGQMPLQRRLPKRGFRSLKKLDTARIRLSELQKIDAELIDLNALKAAGLASERAVAAKVYLNGTISKAVTLRGVSISAGAKAALEAAGGSVEE